MPRESRIVLILTVALFLISKVQPTEAQESMGLMDGPQWLIGYTAKPTQQLLGAGVAAVLSPSGRWGFLADGRISTDRPESRFRRSDVEAGSQPSGSEREAWANVNAAVLRTITPELGLYFGGGVSWRTAKYRQYEVWEEEFPVDMYWVETGDATQADGNLVAGGLFRMGSRLVLQFGWQTAPSGFTVGGYFRVY